MKKLAVFIFLVSITLTRGHSQNVNSTDSANNKLNTTKAFDSNRVLSKVEVQSQFGTEKNSWDNFLKKNINFDIALFNDAPRGIYNVKIKFTIFRDGHPGDFIALTRFGYGMEYEVIRALKKSPNWKPAMQDGNPVNSTRIQTITFAIEQL